MMHGVDKEFHGYIPAYRDIAARLGPAARVCEIGVLSGDSLLLWKELFPQGIVAGVDIDPGRHWPDGTIRVVCDQASDLLPDLLGKHTPAWDLIVDDASHIGSLTAAAYKHLWPLVAPGGYYVIEDWFIGLPHWKTAPNYDPGLLHLVQGLLTLLDEPYRGWEHTAHLPRDSDVESVSCRYGMAIVRKSGGSGG